MYSLFKSQESFPHIWYSVIRYCFIHCMTFHCTLTETIPFSKHNEGHLQVFKNTSINHLCIQWIPLWYQFVAVKIWNTLLKSSIKNLFLFVLPRIDFPIWDIFIHTLSHHTTTSHTTCYTIKCTYFHI